MHSNFAAKSKPNMAFKLSVGEQILRQSIRCNLNNNFNLPSVLVRILELRVLVVIDNSKIAGADNRPE